MTITISAGQTLSDLQQAFHGAFSHLKLAFFTKPHGEHKGSAAKFLISNWRQPLGELNPAIKEGTLEARPDMRTWELEERFEKDFGLHVQVFRKSGNIWLETSVSDDLTLAQQNEKGKNDDSIQQEFVDPMDYREQD